jgi:hypothetical protein
MEKTAIFHLNVRMISGNEPVRVVATRDTTVEDVLAFVSKERANSFALAKEFSLLPLTLNRTIISYFPLATEGQELSLNLLRLLDSVPPLPADMAAGPISAWTPASRPLGLVGNDSGVSKWELLKFMMQELHNGPFEKDDVSLFSEIWMIDSEAALRGDTDSIKVARRRAPSSMQKPLLRSFFESSTSEPVIHNSEDIPAKSFANASANRSKGNAFQLFAECQETLLVEEPESLDDLSGLEVITARQYISEAVELVQRGQFGLVAHAVLGYRWKQLEKFHEALAYSEPFVQNGCTEFEVFVAQLFHPNHDNSPETQLANDVRLVSVFSHLLFFNLFRVCSDILLVRNVEFGNIMKCIDLSIDVSNDAEINRWKGIDIMSVTEVKVQSRADSANLGLVFYYSHVNTKCDCPCCQGLCSCCRNECDVCYSG